MIAAHDFADFIIKLDKYPISAHPNTYVWVQIYLDNNELPLSENYWCIRLMIP